MFFPLLLFEIAEWVILPVLVGLALSVLAQAATGRWWVGVAIGVSAGVVIVWHFSQFEALLDAGLILLLHLPFVAALRKHHSSEMRIKRRKTLAIIGVIVALSAVIWAAMYPAVAFFVTFLI